MQCENWAIQWCSTTASVENFCKLQIGTENSRTGQKAPPFSGKSGNLTYSSAAKGWWLHRNICWGAPASTGEMPLILPGSQCRAQTLPQPRVERGMWCLPGNYHLWARYPGKATEHNSLSAKTTAPEWSTVNAHFPSLGTWEQVCPGPGSQTFLPVPPETSLQYSSCRNNWFFSNSAHINRDRKFIALIQRQILTFCMV